MEADTDSCKNVSLEEYLESIGRDPDDQYRMSVEEKAQIPFNILYAGAVELEEGISSLNSYSECLPYRHLVFYHVTDDIEADIVWRCRYCTFWCEIFDQNIMEDHLCLKCCIIPEFEKLALKLWVTNNLAQRLEMYTQDSSLA